jgi:hypothetical protein
VATALAVEITPCSPTQWWANYYPTVDTGQGRQVEVTTALHRHPLPTAARLQGPTRWLEVSTANPEDPVYAAYPVWGAHLAAGYAAALAVHEAETTLVMPGLDEADEPGPVAFLIPAGQLPEWVLTDFPEPAPEQE